MKIISPRPTAEDFPKSFQINPAAGINFAIRELVIYAQGYRGFTTAGLSRASGLSTSGVTRHLRSDYQAGATLDTLIAIARAAELNLGIIVKQKNAPSSDTKSCMFIFKGRENVSTLQQISRQILPAISYASGLEEADYAERLGISEKTLRSRRDSQLKRNSYASLTPLVREAEIVGVELSFHLSIQENLPSKGRPTQNNPYDWRQALKELEAV